MLIPGPGLNPNVTSQITLAPGETQIIAPAGEYIISLSPYHVYQFLDPVTQTWQTIGNAAVGANTFYSDGTNYRIANQTGHAVGALVTNAGSGYTSVPVVTASAGNSLWRAIVGGAVSTTPTIVNAGVGYTFPPIVTFAAPPSGGVPATGYATLSSGTVASIVVTNQGAGYSAPPTITLSNDPRELAETGQSTGYSSYSISTGYGASAVASLTGSQTITSVLCTDHGYTSGGLGTIPTLTFTGGGGSSAAATVIMCWSITAATPSTPGAGLSGTYARIIGEDNFPATAAAYTNPKTQSQLVSVRSADIRATVTTNALATPVTVYDGGIYTSTPTVLVVPTASVVTTAPAATVTLGGNVGTSYLIGTG